MNSRLQTSDVLSIYIFTSELFENKNDIRYQKDLGGGAILDALIYPLSFVFRILGDEYIDYEPILFYDRENEIAIRMATISAHRQHPQCSNHNVGEISGVRHLAKVQNQVFCLP